MRVKTFLVIVLLITKFLVTAQSNILIEQETHSTYHQVQYTSQQGLMQNSVLDMTFDNQGFLWLTTWKGICRFDGQKFKSFNEARLDVRKGVVTNFLNYRDRILMRGGSYHFIEDGVINYDKTFNDLDSLLFGNDNQYLSASNYQFYNDEHLKDRPQDFFYINDSCLYIFKKNDKNYSLAYFENGKLKQENVLNLSFEAETETEDIKGYLGEAFVFNEQLYWWESNGTLKKYVKGIATNTYETPDFKNDSIIVHWKQNHQPFIYAVKSGELYEFSEKDGEPNLKIIVSGFMPTGLGIRSVINDPLSNDVLVGTEIQGLYRFRKEIFTLLTSTKYPKKNSTLNLINAGNNRVLTNTGMLFSKESNYAFEGFNMDRSTGIFKTKNELPWILSPLTKLNVNPPFTTQKFKSGPNSLNSCVEDKNGRIWCQGEEGLYRYEEGGFQLIPNTKLDLGKMFYNRISDEIWLATTNDNNEDKVYRFRAGSTDFTEVPALEGKQIEQIFFASSGLMFVKITFRKFCVFQNDELIGLPGDGSNYLNNAHCILEDKNRNLWLSSDNGLFRTHLDAVERYVKDPKQSIYYYHYDKDWGFVNNEFNSRGCPCATTLDDGSFVFPSLQGVVVFNPLDVPIEEYGRSPKIESIRINGKDTNLASNPHLNQEFLELEFSIVHPFYDNLNSVYISYKLEGYSDEWSRFPEGGVLRFLRLPYGDYRLVVRKLTGFGENDFIDLEYPFIVAKKYFQTTWFRVLIGTMIALIVWLIFRWRISGIEKRREALKFQVQQKTREYQKLNKELQLNVIELERITAFKEEGIKLRREMISIYAHDIRGPLHFIKLIAQKTSSHLKEIKEETMRDYLDTIKESVEGVFNQTEKMFNWNRAQDDNLPVKFKEVNIEEVLDDELKPLISLAHEKNVIVNCKVDPEIDLFTEEDLLRIVVNNLVQNSIKYTTNGSITIVGEQNEEETSLVFKDTGVGIDAEQLAKINNGIYISQEGTNNETGKAFGLRMVRDILGRLNATLTIESKPNEGTAIKVIFKHELIINEEDIFLN